MKIGDVVKQVVHPITGEIERKQYDEASDGFIYLVAYIDATGEEQTRWFNEAEIETAFVAKPASVNTIPEVQ